MMQGRRRSTLEPTHGDDDPPSPPSSPPPVLPASPSAADHPSHPSSPKLAKLRSSISTFSHRLSTHHPPHPAGPGHLGHRLSLPRIHVSLPGRHPAVPRAPRPPVNDWGLTPAQEDAEVGRLVAALVEAGAAAGPEALDHDELLRFLRARDFHLGHAKKMYLDMLRWRDDWSVDSIYRHFEFKERDAFLEAYPQGYHGVDREGRPIFINRPGRLDLKRVLQVTTPDRVLRSHIQQYEYLMREILPACSRLYGHRVMDTFNIMDVKGVGLSHLTGEVKHVITTTTKVTQDAYPETTGKLLVINAPWIFKTLFAFVRPLLSARTLSKIEVHGAAYGPALLKYVAPEMLPREYGGTSDRTIEDNWGPWQELLENEGRSPPWDPRARNRGSAAPAEEADLADLGAPLGVHVLPRAATMDGVGFGPGDLLSRGSPSESAYVGGARGPGQVAATGRRLGAGDGLGTVVEGKPSEFGGRLPAATSPSPSAPVSVSVVLAAGLGKTPPQSQTPSLNGPSSSQRPTDSQGPRAPATLPAVQPPSHPPPDRPPLLVRVAEAEDRVKELLLPPGSASDAVPASMIEALERSPEHRGPLLTRVDRLERILRLLVRNGSTPAGPPVPPTPAIVLAQPSRPGALSPGPILNPPNGSEMQNGGIEIGKKQRSGLMAAGAVDEAVDSPAYSGGPQERGAQREERGVLGWLGDVLWAPLEVCCGSRR